MSHPQLLKLPKHKSNYYKLNTKHKKKGLKAKIPITHKSKKLEKIKNSNLQSNSS